MNWAIEELVEDAFTAYLRTKLPGTMRAYSAWDLTTPRQYPCAVTHAGDSQMIGAVINSARKIDVEVAVMVEAAPERKGEAALVTARERNMAARSAVIEALFVNDLKTVLSETGVKGLAWSAAQIGDGSANRAPLCKRSVQERMLVSVIPCVVIAAPAEL